MAAPNGNPLRNMLREMISWLLILTFISFLVSLLWGFKMSVLIGFLVGLVYVILSYCYLSETIYRAINRSKKTAQKMMFFCYLSRYLILILLCLVAVKVKFINVFAVLVPQLFPRLVLTLNNFKERKAIKNDESSVD